MILVYAVTLHSRLGLGNVGSVSKETTALILLDCLLTNREVVTGSGRTSYGQVSMAGKEWGKAQRRTLWYEANAW